VCGGRVAGLVGAIGIVPSEGEEGGSEGEGSDGGVVGSGGEAGNGSTDCDSNECLEASEIARKGESGQTEERGEVCPPRPNLVAVPPHCTTSWSSLPIVRLLQEDRGHWQRGNWW
jgi:hypothetical protein